MKRPVMVFASAVLVNLCVMMACGAPERTAQGGTGGGGAGGGSGAGPAGGCCVPTLVQTVSCDTGTGYATALFPGLSTLDITRRVTAISIYSTPNTTKVKGHTLTSEQVSVFADDGQAVAPCDGNVAFTCNDAGVCGTTSAGTVEFTLH